MTWAQSMTIQVKEDRSCRMMSVGFVNPCQQRSCGLWQPRGAFKGKRDERCEKTVEKLVARQEAEGGTEMRLYNYVGPEEIRTRVLGDPPGTRITASRDLEGWLASNEGESVAATGDITTTFVVDPEGALRIVSRHAEHVSCSGGTPVLSAGEMTFTRAQGVWSVSEVSNYSTGFCPEPDSWIEVARALDGAGIRHPGRFTAEFVFRYCIQCGQRNVVKDEWYVCGVCDADLPESWNFDQRGEDERS